MSEPRDDQARRYERRFVEQRTDYRDPAQRDYDRILYSSAFRRLGGVTQVVAAHEGHVFHNRLTHSLRVAQISRRLAQKFRKLQPNECEGVGGIDPDVAEAAALAHDLGHPPFGHIAEEQLRDCVEKSGILEGFEGNAQSFRIVTKLALREKDPPGLNLTRATLDAVLKYPWKRQTAGHQSDKFGVYDSENDDFKFARKLHPRADDRKCAEAEIMDWADDVTYAVHDAEDFYRARLIPLDKLSKLSDSWERKRFFDGMYARTELKKHMGPDERTLLENAFEKAITSFPIAEDYTGTREQRSRLRNFSTNLIGRFVNAITLRVPSKRTERFVEIDPVAKMEVRVLKGLTWFYVICNPALATQQFGQREVIRDLFDIFCNAVTSKKHEQQNIIPFAFRDELLEQESDPKLFTRTVTDLISGMTESGLMKLYGRLTGREMGSVLDHLL